MINPKNFFQLAKIKGIPIFAHWSITALLAIFIFLFIKYNNINILIVFILLLSLILLHELGHAFFVRKFGQDVDFIVLYPVLGYCYYYGGGTFIENGIIAFGGVIFQTILAAFFLIFYLLFNIDNSVYKIIFMMYVPFNIGMIIFNLMPFSYLDGSKAWPAFPSIIKYLHKQIYLK